MPTPLRFDLDKLLSPISADIPAGPSLLYDGVYDRIKSLRREDESALPQGVWKTEPKVADWPAVEALCLETIETRSKDLQVGAWLLEAWLHTRGFAGATDGFVLLHALAESFWDGVHPAIRDGDLEFRMGPVNWINRRLSVDIKLVRLTRPDADGVPAYTFSDWENACRRESLRGKEQATGKTSTQLVTLSSFQQSVLLTPTSFFAALYDDAVSMLENSTTFESLLDEKAGPASPGMPEFRKVTADIVGLLESFLRDRSVTPGEPSQQETDVAAVAEEESNHVDTVLPFRIRSRTHAYQILAETAEYLARTEPHSPTPYLVRRAVAWGSMPLADLLPELVRNQSDLTEIYRLLNLRQENSGR
jgi:type VI secretion system ImpA family protein